MAPLLRGAQLAGQIVDFEVVRAWVRTTQLECPESWRAFSSSRPGFEFLTVRKSGETLRRNRHDTSEDQTPTLGQRRGSGGPGLSAAAAS